MPYALAIDDIKYSDDGKDAIFDAEIEVGPTLQAALQSQRSVLQAGALPSFAESVFKTATQTWLDSVNTDESELTAHPGLDGSQDAGVGNKQSGSSGQGGG